jgi:hypothetical protein
MTAGGSAGNLTQAVKNLNMAWEVTQESWHDVKSQEFQKNYLDPLPGHVATAITVMEEIDLILHKIRSECE